jgi:hypothetical protein
MEDKTLNQELIVQYLLGNLPEEEQVRIEDRAFSDREYLEDIQVVESDLIDAYARGELSARERQQFESRFLASRERQQKVEFARALAKVASDLTVTHEEVAGEANRARPTSPWWKSFMASVFGPRPAVRFLLAAAALLLVVGISWFALQTIRLRGELARLQAERQEQQQAQRQRQEELERQATNEHSRSEELATQLQREQLQREQSEELARQLQQERDRLVRSQREDVGGATPTLLASLILPPGTSRGAGGRPQLVVPRAARLIRLQVGLESGDDYKSFRVELNSSAGPVIWSRDGLRPRATRAGRAVIVELPASALDPGQYELALKGVNDQGTLEAAGYYYFSVLKK